MARKVLIVEDNPHNYDSLSRRLQRRDYETTIATDGQAGVDMFESEAPDIVLLDINLPKLDGKEVARRIRQTGSTVPIIALTAHAMSGDRQEALAAGCDDYHAKPVKFSNLTSQMEKLLKQQEAASDS